MQSSNNSNYSENNILQGWRLVFFRILFVISVVGILFSFTYLVINISIIPGFVKNLTTTGTQDYRFCTNQLCGYFENISKDMSAVTPLVMTLFFGSILWNSMKYIRKDMKKENLNKYAETLPFTVNFDTLWVQLGLIGTLWGLIIIGLGIQKLNERNSSDIVSMLLKSFATALWSTLIAVSFAYVFAPLVISIWKFIFNVVPEDPALAESVDTLNTKLQKISENTNNLAVSIKLLNENIITLNEHLPTAIFERMDTNVIKLANASNEINIKLDKLDTVTIILDEFKKGLENKVHLESDEIRKQFSSNIGLVTGAINQLKQQFAEEGKQSRQQLVNGSETVKTAIAELNQRVEKESKATQLVLSTTTKESSDAIVNIATNVKKTIIKLGGDLQADHAATSARDQQAEITRAKIQQQLNQTVSAVETIKSNNNEVKTTLTGIDDSLSELVNLVAALTLPVGSIITAPSVHHKKTSILKLLRFWRHN
jgi:hypothetical protein